MKLTDRFDLTEFIPKEIYSQYGDKSIWFLDKKIVNVADRIAVMLGKPIIINNWNKGGQNNYCGYRQPDCPTGAKLSQHKRGCAADLHVVGMLPDEVRFFIRKNFKELNDWGLTTIEQDTPTWVHCDCRWTGLDTLLEVPFQ